MPVGLLETDIRQHFHLTEADHAFLVPFRGAANRLGLALQLGVERALEHESDRALLAMTCLKLYQACIVRPAIGALERLVRGISDLASQ